MNVRAAKPADLAALAQLWFDGWHDAHATILPEELARHRTLESFHQRLEEGIDRLRVIGPAGDPLGFALLKDDELNQLYVHARSRGSGIAARLVSDAEARIAEQGAEVAWLACAIGNDRAARFYEKSGWRRVSTMVSRLQIPTGIFSLDVWRYEKVLSVPASGVGNDRDRNREVPTAASRPDDSVSE